VSDQLGSRFAPPAPATVVYRGGPLDGTERVLHVPGGLPTTELAPEDPLGFYGRREQVGERRFVMGWWGMDETEP
jgi:hypothetical protein